MDSVQCLWMFSFSIFTAWSRVYGEELYDHSIDPDEMTNLATRDQFNELKLHLKEMLRRKLNDSMNE